MSLYEILFILVIFLSNIIQTITSFAGTVLAMPFSIQLVGADVAKPVLNVVAIAVSIYVAIRYHKNIDWLLLLKMILFVGLGFAGGIALSYIPNDGTIFLKIYGGIIIAIAIFFLIFPLEKLHLPDWVLYLLLVLGGILHGLYISGGPLIIIFATLKIKDKDAFRATLATMWTILNSILLVQQGVSGLLTSQVGILIAAGIGVTILSIIIGQLLAKVTSKKVFMIITCVLLLISGVSLLIK
ncbi:MAG: sulfite exporter TauE/SafE family protein [Bacilli bacterium]|nr:sulfite exporter TauE/SafE family protein [Bacilli bacterium]